MARRNGKTKAQWVTDEIIKAVGADKSAEVDVVDFSQADRPPACLEVDFPILPINELAKVESSSGAGRKPIYAMSKWWARRSSTVFRALLIAATVKAPDDPSKAAKLVWESFYRNHRKEGVFSHLRIADLFMGGGTTVVEGIRLGMKMYGTDLNPVAWFIVKNELSDVERSDVEALLADIQTEVRPKVMPFYACDCPRGHKGTWHLVATGEDMGDEFDPLALDPEQRAEYHYDGPELIYSFWAKHGPCQVTNCGHRTPIISRPVMAVKALTVNAWVHHCSGCCRSFDAEEQDARMAPNVPLLVVETEAAYAVIGPTGSVQCPYCGHHQRVLNSPKKRKKIHLSLLIHPQWISGEAGQAPENLHYGGSVSDDVESTVRWNNARSSKIRLLEVRGELPDEVICPETRQVIKTGRDGGTVPKNSTFACGACGTVQDVLTSIKASGTSGPVAEYAFQGYCPTCKEEKQPYGGRFFAPVSDTRRFDGAVREWEKRRENDLASWWPRQEIPYGFMTGVANGDIRGGHGFSHWWTMFNPRQLLVHSQLFRNVIIGRNAYRWETKEFVLGILHRYIQHQNMFCFWDEAQDCLAPSLSNGNYHPKSTLVENSVWPSIGRGNLNSCIQKALSALDWKHQPWDLVNNDRVAALAPTIAGQLKGKTTKLVRSEMPIGVPELDCCSATELSTVSSESCDVVITDPPFGGLLHYSELADFFYVWLRLALRDRYPST